MSPKERLGRLDTCAVSDALDRLKLQGVALGLGRLSGDKRICGTAITVQLGPAGSGPSGRHLCTAAVDAAGPGTIIVIAHGRQDVAGWGGILSLGAVVKSVEGVVIDGACRDLDEAREYGLTLYASNAVPITARGRIQEVAWNEPITIAGIRVAPGDLVLADASGVVFVPAARAEEVIGLAEEIAQRERLIIASVRSGSSMESAMGANYEQMLTTAGKAK